MTGSRFLRAFVVAMFLLIAAVFACEAPSGVLETPTKSSSSSQGGQTTTVASGGMGGGGGLGFGGQGGAPCLNTCSKDYHSVIDCKGAVVEECKGAEGCDISTATCTNACAAAEGNKLSVGCEYYATFMDQLDPDSCFAVFVANTWDSPAHISVERTGNALSLDTYAKIPNGVGPGMSYAAFDSKAGIAPGEVVILFLAGPTGVPGQGNPVCPVPAAIPSGAMLADKSGIGKSFRIASDVPVVAYQINPYGGGSAAVTGASLLLPTSAWGTNYVALNAYDSGPHPTSMNIVAKEDGTEVTMVPPVNVIGGNGLPPGSANGVYTFKLDAGEHAQFTQQDALSGSVIEASKPVGFMAGARCSFVPAGTYACDHLEQMIPPVGALGNEYAAVMHRPRSGEPGVWRVLGTVDGTKLAWSNDVGGPATLDQGQLVEFSTPHPFVVKSQDPQHPFLLMSHMSGGATNEMDGVGDADAVLSVPPAQYMSSYVFFADPTYPETNLVVVRKQDEEGFHDVWLDCAGKLSGWKKLGEYEWTRVDLIKDDFEPVGMCTTGRHEISSDGTFGLWIWGWGSPKTSAFTKYVSYGYPGGMNVQTINEVVLPPTPK